MLAEERAQSEAVGVVLVTALFILAVSLVGTALLALQSQQIERAGEPADFRTEINASELTITHSGGSSFALAELDLVLRTNSAERRYDLDDPGDRLRDTLNGDGEFDPGETVTVSHSYTGDIRILLVYTADPGQLLYDETKRVKTTTTSVSPTIETFDINDTSSGGDASYEVTWNASDEQGDITQVTVELLSDGTLVDSASTSFGEVASTGENTDTLTNASGGGEVYKIRLTVTDAAGNTASDSVGDTADSEIGLREPTIEQFQVTDTSTGSEVSYDYTYNASDPDADIVRVELELINTSSGAVVDSVTDNYSQVGSTGERTGTLLDSNSSKKANQEYRIELTVSDLAGNDVVATTTDIADGDGGGGGTGNPPVIERFDVTDTTTPGKNNDATFDVTWRATDVDGNLANATLQLIREKGNKQVDSVSYTSADFINGSDTGELTGTLSDPRGSGDQYTIRIVVNDDTAKSNTDSETQVADGDDSGSPP